MEGSSKTSENKNEQLETLKKFGKYLQLIITKQNELLAEQNNIIKDHIRINYVIKSNHFGIKVN